MIRGNYSLSKEVRKNELKERLKLQQKQKNEHKTQKLTKVDPIRLYLQLQKLEAEPNLDHEQKKRLKTLNEDWQFIKKHSLHKAKVDEFLKQEKVKLEQKARAAKKLWGLASVYFNPELNPLGKVPNINNLSHKLSKELPNATKPIKQKVVYEQDPLIAELGIKPPSGEPPQFYKKVQNTHITKPVAEEKSEQLTAAKPKAKAIRHSALDSDSDAEVYSEEEYDVAKKPRHQ